MREPLGFKTCVFCQGTSRKECKLSTDTKVLASLPAAAGRTFILSEFLAGRSWLEYLHLSAELIPDLFLQGAIGTWTKEQRNVSSPAIMCSFSMSQHTKDAEKKGFCSLEGRGCEGNPCSNWIPIWFITRVLCAIFWSVLFGPGFHIVHFLIRFFLTIIIG